MKKIILILSILISCSSIHAQLKNTRWKGTIKGDNPRDVILDFKTDTLNVYTVEDSAMVETMTYTIDNSTFSITKIEGQSDCDNTVIGKYKFSIENDQLNITTMSDQCDDRSSAIDSTKWIIQKNKRQ